MTNPLVSIIVPVYNAQKGLSRCLESICGQTYQELEIIVLNDGSTDDSLAICEQFRAKDPRIVVVDKENEGVSCTRNAGLVLAHGDYIQFADSDDALDPDYTQNLVQAALQHSADLVIAPYWMVTSSRHCKLRWASNRKRRKLRCANIAFCRRAFTAGRTTPAA